MFSSKQAHLIGKIALIASLGALGACQTMSTERSVGTPAHSAAAVDQTTGEGVYFPAVSSFDTPEVRFGKMAGVGPQQRSVVVDQLNVAVATNAGTLPILVQAVGEDRATLTFTYMNADSAMTPYIARGILARLTSVSRFLPAVTEMGLSSEIDVYNMAAVLGFERIIVTDGRDFAHQANLRQN
jgi:hypothetical protein